MNKIKIEMPGYVEGTNPEADAFLKKLAEDLQEMLENEEKIVDSPPVTDKSQAN